MLSITTTARGTMQGSCRPAISKTAFSRLATSTVRCARAMDGVGLIAARKITGIPLVMPPVTPPLWLLSQVTPSPSMRIASFASLPRISASAMPSPNAIAFTAGTENASWLTTLSTEPKNGEPTPARTPTAAHSITPPTLSCAARASATARRIGASFSGFSSGKRLRASPQSVRASTPTGSNRASRSPAMAAMCAPISIPFSRSSSRATLPANTSGAVSLPEKCPPPRGSFMPRYLT